MKVQITQITFALCCLALVAPNAYETNIIFRVFNSNAPQFNSTFDNNDTLLANCDPSGNYTVLVHGWTESIQSVWSLSMIQEFLHARQGCVFFMDYYYYSKENYILLVANFNGIRAVLTRKLQQLDQLGFKPANAFLFGFSFGAHVVFEGAYQYGPQKVARVDGCDPAGPGFPENSPSVIHAKNSGQHVQCIHTSFDEGTTLRYCQKDVDMGVCGFYQTAATSSILSSLLLSVLIDSHDLCPIFYNNSFVYDFPLVPKATVETTYKITCYNKTITPDVTVLGPTQMGFWFNMNIADGEYYSLTGNLPPYNTI